MLSQTDVPVSSKIPTSRVSLRPHSQVPVTGVWPAKVMLHETQILCTNELLPFLHSWALCLSTPMHPTLRMAGYHQHQNKSHARHTVIISSRLQKETLLEDVLFYMDTQKQFLNGRFNMTRQWVVMPNLLYLWSPSTKHNLCKNHQRLVVFTDSMKDDASPWVMMGPALTIC